MYRPIRPIDVIVGEPNDGHAELLEASLREAGIVKNFYRCRDGAETMAVARGTARDCKDHTLRPSLVLLDCRLPHAGGADVLTALKRDRRRSWIPVIMMTTTADQRQRERYLHLGCEAFVTKWVAFLGLRGFATRVRVLASRDPWIAKRSPAIVGSHGCYAGTGDLQSVCDAPRTRRQGSVRLGKEVCDASFKS